MAILFYVIGPSGSGKDSIMSYARGRLGERSRCVFAHRYITRPMDAGGENHVAVSVEEFERRRRLGLFCLYWGSHGLRYGVGLEIESWMAQRCNVVVNGSRGYLDEASRRIPQIVPVLISVSPDVLRERLVNRGRETLDEIEKRIQRNALMEVSHPRLARIENDGPLEQAGERFLELISPSTVGVG